MLNLQQFFWFVWLCNNVQTVHKASKFRESKCGHQGSRRQMSVWRLTIMQFFGFKLFFFNLTVIASKKNCSGRQMPPRGIGVSNATRRYWGVKCQPGVLGRQMPPGGIGASNATRGYWGVKGHIGIIGESKAIRASKGRRQGS